MFCCMTVPAVEEDKPLVVDLKKIICDKAWKSYSSTFTFCQKRFLDRDKFNFEVPENFFLFEDVQQTIRLRKSPVLAPDASPVPRDTQVSQNDSLQIKKHCPQDLTRPEVLSLDTVFNNDTAESQMYKFRFEKTRRTEISVSFQKGFTIGGKANFSIGIPKLLGDGNIGAEIEMQYQVSKSEGQTFEETMVMEATSDIKVGPKSCYTANVQLEEKSLNADFTVVTRMSIPQGKAPVYIKRKSDGEVVFVYNVKNLVDTFDKELVPCAVPEKTEGKDDPTKINFVTEGVLKGTMACNHKIQLSSDEPEDIKNQALARAWDTNEGNPRHLKA
ncbi:uncharacterized protein LOC106058788 [Biomphalaria glabrata]|uniref:Uncharacterized protein LOC106058788 n=2 Tax=Biomphalaria glabrata TaxID=6526 RepID=A0A9W2Z0I5_BIOGL|nr:uncharacterized protein LOC106058788 [Biomphalaria glabrata]XP_055868457.1 uncharacterized protein LOC106058788 [Biomphalaria glabrata]KAI8770807.1 hypothetical protein BgiBS90_028693 [Biomphalaria glabrata]